MGISNISSNLRPGVVANEASRPTTPYEGQVIYQTDTDRAYVWNGSLWVDLSTGKSGRSGLVRVTPTSVSGTGASLDSNGDVVVSSGGTNFTVNGVFSADYRNYKLIVSDYRASTPTGLGLSMGTSLTGSSHKYATLYVSSSGTVAGTGSGGTTFFDCPVVTRGTTDSGAGEITLFSPFETIETSVSCLGSDSDNTALLRFMSGRLVNNTSYSDCYFSLTSGGGATFSAIRVSFYGYN